MQVDVQICMVSAQPAPNLLPVISPELKPKRVVLLVSKDMQEQAALLEKIFQRYQIKCGRVQLDDVYNIDAIAEKIGRLVAELKAKKESILMNLTGGTKPMAIAAQQVCYFDSPPVPYFYMPPDGNEVQLYNDGQMRRITLKTRLTMEVYLQAHGYGINGTPSPAKRTDAKITHLMETLVANAQRNEAAIGLLNRLAHEAQEKQSLDVSLPLPCNEDFERLVADFDHCGLAWINGSQLHFASEDARAFANGGWLEEYVYSQVARLPDVQECRKNVEVSRGKVRNEVDVAILCHNRLFLIECKTSRFNEDDGRGSDILYKLKGLNGLGGLTTKAMLASYRTIDMPTRERAKTEGIETVDCQQLKNIQNRINTWIRK